MSFEKLMVIITTTTIGVMMATIVYVGYDSFVRGSYGITGILTALFLICIIMIMLIFSKESSND